MNEFAGKNYVGVILGVKTVNFKELFLGEPIQ